MPYEAKMGTILINRSVLLPKDSRITSSRFSHSVSLREKCIVLKIFTVGAAAGKIT